MTFLFLLFFSINFCFSTFDKSKFYDQSLGEQIAKNNNLYESTLNYYLKDYLFDNLLIEWKIVAIHYENQITYTVSFRERKPLEGRWISDKSSNLVQFTSHIPTECEFTFFTFDMNFRWPKDQKRICDLILEIKRELTDQLFDFFS